MGVHFFDDGSLVSDRVVKRAGLLGNQRVVNGKNINAGVGLPDDSIILILYPRLRKVFTAHFLLPGFVAITKYLVGATLLLANTS